MKLKVCKYVAIKVNGLNHWLWFVTENTTEESGKFMGKGGWGDGGAFTEIEVNTSDIIGRMYSETLQYK